MRHGTPINASWHTYEWVMAHTWMSHGTCMNESWHTHEHDSTSSRRTTRRESLGGFVDRGVFVAKWSNLSRWVWTPSIHEHPQRLEHPPIHEHNESTRTPPYPRTQRVVGCWVYWVKFCHEHPPILHHDDTVRDTHLQFCHKHPPILHHHVERLDVSRWVGSWIGGCSWQSGQILSRTPPYSTSWCRTTRREYIRHMYEWVMAHPRTLFYIME